MLTFEPQDFSERDNYTLLTGSIIPRPIAFVTSSSNQEILNAAPFSYFNMVTADPPLISVSIQRKDGRSKDTVQNITEKQEFVVHIVDESNLQDVNQTAASLDPNHNELDLTSFTLAKSLEIDVPGVQEARVRFECQLVKIIELGGDAKSPSTDLVIGKIVRYHIDEKVYKNGKVDPKALGAISRLAGANYATLGDIITIKRPK